jgi:hypothetical protein
MGGKDGPEDPTSGEGSAMSDRLSMSGTGDTDDGTAAPVGEGDLEADRVRSGAKDAVSDDVPRDVEDVPVGSGDAEADIQRSKGDVDEPPNR